ncbi:MAG: TIM44-like domain-containing protein [Alphaproteobacteria bacterium]|nr:TIM44-like domain-containing protein [Alphaproteobacteria bacterium]
MRWRVVLSLFFCLMLALAPSLAEARAGGSFSGGGMRSAPSGMGSRGTRTFEDNGAGSITRSMQAPTPSPSPSFGAPYGAPAYGGSFFQRHPFLTGLFGGYVGSMLFGGYGMGHIFGGLIQWILIGFLIWFVIRLFAGRGASFASGGGMMPRSLGAAAAPMTNRYRGQDVQVTDADLNAFQGLHAAVQDAWSRADLGRLRQLMTPEMLSYFSEELTRNSSQGVQNVVSNVRLLKGDVNESWVEGDLQYATAYMRWSAIDHVVRLGTAAGQPDSVVSGDPRTPVESEEVWTFVRRRGGNWLLSAIQQV